MKWPVLAFCSALLLGCGSSEQEEELQAEVDDLHFQMAALETKTEEAQAAADDMAAAAAALTGETDRFEDENWRDVVGDVRSSAAEVEIAAGDVTVAAAEVVDTLE